MHLAGYLYSARLVPLGGAKMRLPQQPKDDAFRPPIRHIFFNGCLLRANTGKAG